MEKINDLIIVKAKIRLRLTFNYSPIMWAAPGSNQ